MDFFEQQHLARKQTRLLIIWLLLAVVCILIAVNGVTALAMSFVTPRHVWDYPHEIYYVNTYLILLFIVGGTIFEIYNLREGGDAVAKMAGGRLVSASTSDPHERQLLNVVAEMGLAASIACPKTYVLDREAGINAFAAGYNPSEAVVAVTQGALKRLTRDELQGVMAHEFSHILNGDMRLNMRLLGVLFGIQMVAGFGEKLLDLGSNRASRLRLDDDDEEDASSVPRSMFMLVMGAIFFVIGYIGIFFARLIKSAISRQREFLADASAVQFTRNPDTIGGALRKIVASRVKAGPAPASAMPMPCICRTCSLALRGRS